MATFNIGKLLIQIAAGTKALQQDLTKAQSMLEGFGKRVGDFGRQLTMKLSAPVAAAGGLAVRQFAMFDKAMAQSTAIMGDLSSEMQASLEKTARSISKQLPISAKELGEAYFYLASAGLNAEQSLAALPLVAKFATAGQFDLNTATTLLADSQKALGLASEDATENLVNMTKVADALVKANTLSNASVEQFASALTNKAAAAFRFVGKPMEEAIAALAVFADQGVKGEEAGTQLSIVARDLEKAIRNNAAAWEDFNIQVYDAGEMRNIADIMQDLEKILAGAGDEQRSLTLATLGFTDKSIAATKSLLGFSASFREYEKAIYDAGGTTEMVTKKQIQNLLDQMVILWNNVTDVAIGFGKVLAPSVKAVIDQLKSFLEWLQQIIEAMDSWSDLWKRIVGYLTMFLAISGPLLVAISGLTWVLRMALIPALKTLLTTIRFLAISPWGRLITIIAALTVTFYNLFGGVSKVNEELDKLDARSPADTMRQYEEWVSRARVGVEKLDSRIESLEGTLDEIRKSAPGKQGWAGLPRAEDIQSAIDALKDRRGALEASIAQWEEAWGRLFKPTGPTMDQAGFVGAMEDRAVAVTHFSDAVTEAAEEARKQIAYLTDEQRISSEQSLRSFANFYEWVQSLKLSMADLYDSMVLVGESISTNISGALAQAIVYGQSFKDSMLEALKSIAATIIQFFANMLIQQALFWVISSLGLAAAMAESIASSAARGAAGAVASLFETTPWFVALGMAPFVAASAIGAIQSAAALGFLSGATGLKEGGIVTSPILAMIGEGNYDEAVIPLKKNNMFGDTTVVLEMDGRTMTKVVVPHLGREIRYKLGRIF